MKQFQLHQLVKQVATAVACVATLGLSAQAQAQAPLAQAQAQSQSNDILSEFDEKFEVLANEIADLKDIVLKLQSYTMDVNKMLMEERINVLSDMGETELASAAPKKEVTFNLTEIEENQ